MRIVVDLQPCQGLSRYRGIGRYTMAFTKALVREAFEHEVVLILNGNFPESIDSIRREFAGILPSTHIRVFHASQGDSWINPSEVWKTDTAELIRESFILSLKPDVLLVASLFEGFGSKEVTSIRGAGLAARTAVIHYDLIPLINSDVYLGSEEVKCYYRNKIDHLKRAGRLLAISEYSKCEAIRHLGIEEGRIVSISAAIEPKFKPVVVTEEQSVKLKNRYGIRENIVMYAPGGFDPRKNFETLIEAYSKLPSNIRSKRQLVIVGKLPNSQIRDDLNLLAKNAGLCADELIMTDYIPEEELVVFYNLAELFVFPSLHEGFGLPPLEAMACGIPVLASDSTSLPEVIGLGEALFPPKDSEFLASLIARALTDLGFSNVLRKHSLKRAAEFGWERCARVALESLESLVSDSGCHPQKIANISEAPTDSLVQKIAQSYDSLGLSDDDIIMQTAFDIESSMRTPELLFDITMLVQNDVGSGVHRVVKNILKQLLINPPRGYAVRPVYLDSQLILKYANAYLAVKMTNHAYGCIDYPVAPRSDDVYLGIDLTAHLFPLLEQRLNSWREMGVIICYVVYDLISLYRPEFCYKEINDVIATWIEGITLHAHQIICISKAVASDLNSWLDLNKDHAIAKNLAEAQRLEQSSAYRPAIGHFHLGAELDSNLEVKLGTDSANELLHHEAVLAADQRLTFLSVSTVEPRKGYRQLVASFEELWNNGHDFGLIIVGKEGWNMSDFAEKLRNHPELNKRLFWLEGIPDDLLDVIYTRSAALVFASEAEGFGLALVEAAQHGMPVIARDLPVFREIAEDHAYYFEGLNSSDLADAIKRWTQLYLKGQQPKSENLPWLTWRESADQLVTAMGLIPGSGGQDGFAEDINAKRRPRREFKGGRGRDWPLWQSRYRDDDGQFSVIEGGLRTRGTIKSSRPGEPLVSYVTVVLNRAASLERTLESVRIQSYPNVEHIVFDGGSTDGTIDLIVKHEAQIDYFVSSKDFGIYDALNRAIPLCNGDIICVLNSDDWLDQKSAEVAVEAISRPDEPIVLATAAGITNNNSEVKWLPERIGLGNYMICANICHNGVYATRRAYELAGPYDPTYKIAGDFKWLMRCIDAGALFCYEDQITVNYSLGGASGDVLMHSYDCMRVVSERFPFLSASDISGLFHCFFSLGSSVSHLIHPLDCEPKDHIKNCIARHGAHEDFVLAVQLAAEKLKIPTDQLFMKPAKAGKIRIAYVDHSYHQKTISTKFLVDILRDYGHEVDCYWDDSWRGGKSVAWDGVCNYDAVVMFMSMPDNGGQTFAGSHPNIVYIPMLDQFGLWLKHLTPITPFWTRFEGCKMLNFSYSVHCMSLSAGVISEFFRYYQPIPDASAVWDGKLRGFFWIRRETDISWATIRSLIAPGEFEYIHLHLANDPETTLDILPTEQEIKDYNIRFSKWFDNKEDFVKVQRDANVFFAPRMGEGIGQSFIEAMAYGQCVVVPDQGTMNEYVIHGVNGFTYDSKFPRKLDYSQAREMGANARRSTIEGRLRWEQSTSQVVDFIITPSQELYNSR